jgi:hypothetical protein
MGTDSAVLGGRGRVALALAAVTLGWLAAPAAAQGPDATVGIASVIGGGEQETTYTHQNHENCGGGIDTGSMEHAQFAPGGPPPSVAVFASRAEVRVSPVASIPVRVSIDRPNYFGPERISSACDSPTEPEDCGSRIVTADLTLLPIPGGIELRGGPRPRTDPFSTCYRPPATVDYPQIVSASAPISAAAVALGPFDLALELRGGPTAFSLPGGHGSTSSTFRLRLIGAVAPLLSLGGPRDTATVGAKAGVAPVPVECSSASRGPPVPARARARPRPPPRRSSRVRSRHAPGATSAARRSSSAPVRAARSGSPCARGAARSIWS